MLEQFFSLIVVKKIRLKKKRTNQTEDGYFFVKKWHFWLIFEKNAYSKKATTRLKFFLCKMLHDNMNTLKIQPSY